ncbi:hypothetical protein DRQ53_15400, partial [bacterium]
MPVPNADAARRISRSVKWTERTLRSQSKRGRRFRALGAGGTSTRAHGMITDTIPAADFNGNLTEVTPGESATAVVKVLKWNEAGDKLVEDTDVAELKGRNVTSTSEVVGTVSEPVVMPGAVQTIDG